MSPALADEVSGVLGLVMLAGTILFITLYLCCSRWKETALGRHMLYFMLAFALVLTIRACGVFFPGIAWLAYIRIVTYTLLALAIWQRVYLLIRTLRSEES
jgi:hypothetical protein